MNDTSTQVCPPWLIVQEVQESLFFVGRDKVFDNAQTWNWWRYLRLRWLDRLELLELVDVFNLKEIINFLSFLRHIHRYEVFYISSRMHDAWPCIRVTVASSQSTYSSPCFARDDIMNSNASVPELRRSVSRPCSAAMNFYFGLLYIDIVRAMWDNKMDPCVSVQNDAVEFQASNARVIWVSGPFVVATDWDHMNVCKQMHHSAVILIPSIARRASFGLVWCIWRSVTVVAEQLESLVHHQSIVCLYLRQTPTYLHLYLTLSSHYRAASIDHRRVASLLHFFTSSTFQVLIRNLQKPLIFCLDCIRPSIQVFDYIPEIHRPFATRLTRLDNTHISTLSKQTDPNYRPPHHSISCHIEVFWAAVQDLVVSSNTPTFNNLSQFCRHGCNITI